MTDVAILILAAGSSSRMGEPKQLLSLGKQNLINTVIENALKSSAKKVFCVLGAYAKEIENTGLPNGVKILYNSEWQNGLGTSIAVGVEQISSLEEEFSGLLLILGDQPKVDFKYINKLIALFKEDPSKIIASKYKSGNGVPVLFPLKYFGCLTQLSGDKGAKHFLKEINSDHIEVIDEIGLLDDLDTPEDYQKFLNHSVKL
ncbi:nucleotidyltransferase family protein [Zhouia amylolytica]|uniref:nucleotidyltransferase family protein n=1 Tax=Zhouia amylolytica TaxID=376730 RepID=UPI0020CD4EAA|nr:nucleotidyltransferase family protein [Zhouia amylolytica]MCQ0110016.1 nucleotidyltransferase family protein [Zhouia amylolytica]